MGMAICCSVGSASIGSTAWIVCIGCIGCIGCDAGTVAAGSPSFAPSPSQLAQPMHWHDSLQGMPAW